MPIMILVNPQYARGWIDPQGGIHEIGTRDVHYQKEVLSKVGMHEAVHLWQSKGHEAAVQWVNESSWVRYWVTAPGELMLQGRPTAIEEIKWEVVARMQPDEVMVTDALDNFIGRYEPQELLETDLSQAHRSHFFNPLKPLHRTRGLRSQYLDTAYTVHSMTEVE